MPGQNAKNWHRGQEVYYNGQKYQIVSISIFPYDLPNQPAVIEIEWIRISDGEKSKFFFKSLEEIVRDAPLDLT